MDHETRCSSTKSRFLFNDGSESLKLDEHVYTGCKRRLYFVNRSLNVILWRDLSVYFLNLSLSTNFRFVWEKYFHACSDSYLTKLKSLGNHFATLFIERQSKCWLRQGLINFHSGTLSQSHGLSHHWIRNWIVRNCLNVLGQKGSQTSVEVSMKCLKCWQKLKLGTPIIEYDEANGNAFTQGQVFDVWVKCSRRLSLM